MRPIELIVEGFTSFRARQTLSFVDLDLFAITGATGAGKTSLLDAITFALYDKVAQKPNASKELVSQGANLLRVELRFMMRQAEYRAIRTWRNRGKTDEKKFLLEKLVDGDWEPWHNQQKVEEIIGMDFETFTRVIVLPQGKFDEFLKGEASKRREILRQLAGFQIFEQMRKEASDRHSRYRAEREGLEKVLEGMQVPTELEVQTQQKLLTDCEKSVPEYELKVKHNQELLANAKRLFAQIQQYAQLTIQLESLQQDANQIQILETQLQRSQRAYAVMGTWQMLQSLRQRLESATLEQSTTSQNLASAQSALAQQELIYEQFQASQSIVQNQITEQQKNLAIAASLDQQQQQSQKELQNAEQNLLERSQSHTKLNAAYQQAVKNLANLERELQNITGQVQRSPDQDQSQQLQKLQQAVEPFRQWQIARANLIKQQQKVEQSQIEISQFHDQLVPLQSAIADQESQLATLGETLQNAEATNATVLQTSHVHALRAHLHDGDRCPVCEHNYNSEGLTTLPNLELIDVQPLVKQKAQIESILTKSLQSRIKLETNLANSQSNLQAQTQEVTELSTQLNELKKQINRILEIDLEKDSETDWQNRDLLRDRQSLETQVQAHQALTLKQKEIAIAHENAVQQLQIHQENLQLAQKELQKAEQERSLRQTNLVEISQQLQTITAGKSYADLQKELAAVQTEISDRAQTAQKSYQRAREQLIQAEAAAAKALESFTKTNAEYSQQDAHWQTELANLQMTELEFHASLVARSQMEQWQQQINQHQRQYQEITTRMQMYSEAIADQHTDPEAIAALQNQLQQSSQQLQQATETRASLKAWLEQAQQKRQESQDLAERQNLLQSQEQTYHILTQDLRSDKFQEYILDSLQQELANRASELLQQLSDQRYILQIENADYWVADNWNGGEKRRVKTLSGGETFAASLSMALALSERLSMGIELGSLFLDEGFGTLDSETLESVTQILESLRQQDRLIGVITHIQSLADRLPTQIHVRKSINGSELVVL